MLWQIAVNVEEGSFADAKAELEALRKELQRALREGAPPERIAELTQKLREAMDRYMQSSWRKRRSAWPKASRITRTSRCSRAAP